MDELHHWFEARQEQIDDKFDQLEASLDALLVLVRKSQQKVDEPTTASQQPFLEPVEAVTKAEVQLYNWDEFSRRRNLSIYDRVPSNVIASLTLEEHHSFNSYRCQRRELLMQLREAAREFEWKKRQKQQAAAWEIRWKELQEPSSNEKNSTAGLELPVEQFSGGQNQYQQDAPQVFDQMTVNESSILSTFPSTEDDDSATSKQHSASASQVFDEPLETELLLSRTNPLGNGGSDGLPKNTEKETNELEVFSEVNVDYPGINPILDDRNIQLEMPADMAEVAEVQLAKSAATTEATNELTSSDGGAQTTLISFQENQYLKVTVTFDRFTRPWDPGVVADWMLDGVLKGARADIVLRGYYAWNSRRAIEVLDQIFPKDAAIQPSLVIVYFGGNDSMGPHSSGMDLHVSPPEYVENMRTVATHLKSLSDSTRLIFLSCPPLNEAKFRETTSSIFSELVRTNDLCQRYSEACIELGQEMDVKVVDLWTAIQKREDWPNVSIMKNGFHLSAEGSKVVVEEILKVLKETECTPSLYWKSMRTEFGEGSPYYLVASDGKTTLNPSGNLFAFDSNDIPVRRGNPPLIFSKMIVDASEVKGGSCDSVLHAIVIANFQGHNIIPRGGMDTCGSIVVVSQVSGDYSFCVRTGILQYGFSSSSPIVDSDSLSLSVQLAYAVTSMNSNADVLILGFFDEPWVFKKMTENSVVKLVGISNQKGQNFPKTWVEVATVFRGGGNVSPSVVAGEIKVPKSWILKATTFTGDTISVRLLFMVLRFVNGYEIEVSEFWAMKFSGINESMSFTHCQPKFKVLTVGNGLLKNLGVKRNVSRLLVWSTRKEHRHFQGFWCLPAHGARDVEFDLSFSAVFGTTDDFRLEPRVFEHKT